MRKLVWVLLVVCFTALHTAAFIILVTKKAVPVEPVFPVLRLKIFIRERPKFTPDPRIKVVSKYDNEAGHNRLDYQGAVGSATPTISNGIALAAK